MINHWVNRVIKSRHHSIQEVAVKHHTATDNQLYLNKGGTWVTNMRMWSLTKSLSLCNIFCWASTLTNRKANNQQKKIVFTISLFHYLNSIYDKKSIPESGDQFFATKFLKWILATCRTPISQLLSTMICNNLTRCWGANWNFTYINPYYSKYTLWFKK
jgi:hypothetical protein